MKLVSLLFVSLFIILRMLIQRVNVGVSLEFHYSDLELLSLSCINR